MPSGMTLLFVPALEPASGLEGTLDFGKMFPAHMGGGVTESPLYARALEEE